MKSVSSRVALFIAACSLMSWGIDATAAPATQATPKWLWHTAVPVPQAPKGSKPVEACFRRIITLPAHREVAQATLVATGDASVFRVYVNGVQVCDKATPWTEPWEGRVGRHIRAGRNVIGMVAAKPVGWAGVVATLTVNFVSGPPLEVVTDRQWEVSTQPRADWTAADFAVADWPAARELGPLSMAPWNLKGLEPSPQCVPWPTAPATRPLTPKQAEALIEADWLQHAGNDPTLQTVRDEMAAAQRLAARLADHPQKPSFAAELGALAELSQSLRSIGESWKEEEKVLRAYLAVRRVKRQILLRNPVLDFQRLLLVDGMPPSGHESAHRDCRDGGGGRMVMLDGLRPDASAVDVVAPGLGGILRMDLAFDASRVVFGMVPKGGRSSHLYEVDLKADGTPAAPPRQLTNSLYHDMDPIYLPDGRIAFCTTRGNTYVRCLPQSPCTVLARCDADGSNIRMISNNNEPDYTPALLPDGRILFTRWEYTERPLWRLQALWTMNPDGTGLAHYWGNRSTYPDMLWDAKPIPGTDRAMFTGVGHHEVTGGPIGIIDVNEGRDFPDGLFKVTAETPWTEVGDPRTGNRVCSPHYRGSRQIQWFTSPTPLGPQDFLVSAYPRRSTGGTACWLYLMDTHGNRELIYAGTGPRGVWCAAPLRPRPIPRTIPDKVKWPAAGEKADPGVFYSSNIHEGTDLPRGSVKYLRVLQQDHKTYSMGDKSFRHSGPVISALQEDAVKRILGTAPIAEDGSVSFKAPAGAAVYFQLLDAEQRCLQIMRSFVGVMPGENRGCVGCHEAHSTSVSPPATRRYEPVELTPPPWGAHVSISYERFAQPVLDKHCGKCHQGDGKGRKVLDLTLRGGMTEKGIDDPKLLPFKEPYLTLIGDTSWAGRPPYVDPKGRGYGLAGALPVEAGHRGSDPYGPLKPMSALSYTSPLIKLATSGRHNDVKIQGEDLLRLIAWVDANCVYRGEEEVRQIPDPDEALMKRHGYVILPRTRTAPVIDRLQAVTDPIPGRKGK